MQFNENEHFIHWEEDEQIIHVLSYDENPGIQAAATTSEELPLMKTMVRSAGIMNIKD